VRGCFEEASLTFPLRYVEVHELERDWPAFVENVQRH